MGKCKIRGWRGRSGPCEGYFLSLYSESIVTIVGFGAKKKYGRPLVPAILSL